LMVRLYNLSSVSFAGKSSRLVAYLACVRKVALGGLMS
jgi:hypothetical protein